MSERVRAQKGAKTDEAEAEAEAEEPAKEEEKDEA